MAATATIPEKISIREVVKLTLPKEHGSWSLAMEPLALGMLAAPSAAGCALVIAAVAAFFLRRPLKLVLSGKADPRVPLASGVVIALSMSIIASLLLVVAIGGVKNLWPLIPAVIAGTGFAWFDSRNGGREGAAELCGAIAFGVLPSTFAIMAGWSPRESLALAAVMLFRSVPTVLFVRAYLRRNKGYAINPAPAFLTTGFGLLFTTWLVYSNLAPRPAAAFALFLTAGTFWMLNGNHRVTAKKIGIVEMAFGILMVFTLAFSWNYH